jgi:signal transduction histidine kinase
LAELHGGWFHIDSRKGHGTTVTLTLPVTRKPPEISTAAPVIARRSEVSAA